MKRRPGTRSLFLLLLCTALLVSTLSACGGQGSPGTATPSPAPTESPVYTPAPKPTDYESGSARAVGTCGKEGDNLHWTLYSTGTLVISGTGEMKDFGSAYSMFDFSGDAPSWGDNVTRLVLEEGVTSVGDNAFSGCSRLKSVYLPEGLTRIGHYAFYSCGMSSVDLPDSLLSLEENPFSFCSALDTVYISPEHPTLVSVDGVLFSREEHSLLVYPAGMNLEEYEIPEGTLRIGEMAFHGCKLEEISLPDSLDIPDSNPFAHCRKLTEIHVSSEHPRLQTVDGVLFSREDSRLIAWPYADTRTEYAVPEGTRLLGDHAFYGSRSLERVTLPRGIERIGSATFAYTHLVGINLPEGLREIGEKAFYQCTRLTDPSFPSGLERIGSRAFYGCNNFRSVVLPEGLLSLGDEAFAGCGAMTGLTLPDSLSAMGVNPFHSCEELASIRLSPDHPYLSLKDGALFSTPDARLIWYPIGCQASAYVIPEGTREIGDYAFYGSGALREVRFPESLLSIGKDAFLDCEGLEAALLPEGLKRLDDSVFFYCSGLTNVYLPESLESFGRTIFFGCSALNCSVAPGSPAEAYCIENGVPYTCR